MLKPSDFNNAVPKFQNGTYANNPLDPTDVAEPTMEDYVRGVEPLDTLPAQWWNWLCNQFTSRFNKINTYVKNVFDELTQLLSLVGVTPDGTEGTITTGQLKNAFEQRYPNFLSKFIHTIAQIWSYTGSSTSGTVTTTQASRLAVFEKVTQSDSSTSPATVTDTYNTKYVDTLPVRLGGTGANTKQGALANLTCELTTPEVLPQDADVIINNNGVVQKTPVSSIVSYAGTVSIENSTADSAIPVALCTGFTNVGKSNCCPLTYNPATGALVADKSIGVCDTSTCGAQNIICKLVDIPSYKQWILLHDITDWYNGSTSVSAQYMIGRFYISRQTGYVESTILDVVMAHSYGRAGFSLECNVGRQRFLYNIVPGMGSWEDINPVIICENATGKVYTALRKMYANPANLSFSGANYGNIINCVVPGGGQDVTIPSGWTHLYEAPLGGMVSCAERATQACSNRIAGIALQNCCWIKIGTFGESTESHTLELTINRHYSYAKPEQKKLTIMYGGYAQDPEGYRIIEDSNNANASDTTFSCIRIGKPATGTGPVDIYIKYNSACQNNTNIEYKVLSGKGNKLNPDFTPSFTMVSDTCASACACNYNIPLHANGHYINGCQFDTTCVNTCEINLGANVSNGIRLIPVGCPITFQCDIFKAICSAARWLGGKAYPVWGMYGCCKFDYIYQVNSTCYTIYSGSTCLSYLCGTCTAASGDCVYAIFAKPAFAV